jgi:hypothetical protein
LKDVVELELNEGHTQEFDEGDELKLHGFTAPHEGSPSPTEG